jgi:hypothetical protein
MIWSKWTAFDNTWVATGEVNDYRRRSRTLADVAAWGDGQVNITGGGEPERVASAAVTDLRREFASRLLESLNVNLAHTCAIGSGTRTSPRPAVT